MSFPRYPKYKASGVEWLGDVPEGWEVTALKRGFSVTLGKMLQPDANNPDDELLPYLRAANIQWGAVDMTDIKQMWLSKRDRAQLRLEKGDLLVSEGGDVGRSCLWAGEVDECYFQNSVNRIRVRDGNSNQYLCYWMSTIKDKGYIDVLCNKSTIAHFTAEKVAAVPVPYPPASEQTAIAEFLDRETGKIDELVAEQRRLMELLKEKRQAVISHAVTKGLNPHAPMKPSGIEWLGDVPAGWVIGKLDYACKLKGGFAFAAGDFGTDGVAVVKMNNLKRGRLDLSEAARIPESSCNESVSLCEGDLVWGMSGSTGETGSLGNFARVCSADLPCQLNQRVGRFKADNTKLDLNFIEQVIQTPYFYEQIMLLVTGTAQYNVSSEQVQSCIFALPPLSEQTTIVEFLRTELAKFDTLTVEAQRAIDLLQERRTALISAAVTGPVASKLKDTERAGN